MPDGIQRETLKGSGMEFYNCQLVLLPCLSMPRRSAENGPSIEELFSKLEKRMVDCEDKHDKDKKEVDEKLECIAHKLENFHSYFDEMINKKNKEAEEKTETLFQKVFKLDALLQEEMEENEQRMEIQKECLTTNNKRVKEGFSTV